MNPAELAALQAPPPDLLGLVRLMYPGWEIHCHTKSAGSDRWTARYRSGLAPHDLQIGIRPHLEASSGMGLANLLAMQVELVHNNGSYRWSP